MRSTGFAVLQSVYVWYEDIGQRLYFLCVICPPFYIWYVGYFFQLYYLIFNYLYSQFNSIFYSLIYVCIGIAYTNGNGSDRKKQYVSLSGLKCVKKYSQQFWRLKEKCLEMHKIQFRLTNVLSLAEGSTIW